LPDHLLQVSQLLEKDSKHTMALFLKSSKPGPRYASQFLFVRGNRDVDFYSGLGQACMSLASTQRGSCAYHPGNPACDLQQMTAYDHLAHLYIQCTNHFERAITKLGHDVTLAVRDAMRSLASAYPLTGFEGTKELMRDGGKKAAGKSNSNM